MGSIGTYDPQKYWLSSLFIAFKINFSSPFCGLLLLESSTYIYVFMKWKLYFGVYIFDVIWVLHGLYMKNEINRKTGMLYLT